MPRHWSEQYSCYACGAKFRTAIAEARHRHNFPVLCRRNKQFERFCNDHAPQIVR